MLVSPQPLGRMHNEIQDKCSKDMAKDVIVPKAIKAMGRKLIATFSKGALGDLPDKFGIQVLLGSNEGFPSDKEILSRRVNEYEGSHRFGGGSDYDGDPHFLDILMPPAQGKEAEKDAQHALLKNYVSAYEAEKNKLVELVMVYR